MTRRFHILLLLVAFVSLSTAGPACASAMPGPAAEPATSSPVCQLRATAIDASVAATAAPLQERIGVVAVASSAPVAPAGAEMFARSAFAPYLTVRPPLRTILRI